MNYMGALVGRAGETGQPEIRGRPPESRPRVGRSQLAESPPRVAGAFWDAQPSRIDEMHRTAQFPQPSLSSVSIRLVTSPVDTSQFAHSMTTRSAGSDGNGQHQQLAQPSLISTSIRPELESIRPVSRQFAVGHEPSLSTTTRPAGSDGASWFRRQHQQLPPRLQQPNATTPARGDRVVDTSQFAHPRTTQSDTPRILVPVVTLPTHPIDHEALTKMIIQQVCF